MKNYVTPILICLCLAMVLSGCIFARNKIKALSSDILAGKVPVAPYRRGTKSPCVYCDYRALCRFDWQTHRCRILDSKTKTEVLESLEADYP